MKALLRGMSPATGYAPIDPGIYTGSSSGAVNAAIMLSQSDTSAVTAVDALETIWVRDIADDGPGCGNGAYRIRGNLLRYVNPACVAADPVGLLADLAGDVRFYARDWLRRGVEFVQSDARLHRRVLELVDLTTLFSAEPFRRRVPELVKLDVIRRSRKLLRIMATNWRTGVLRVFRNEDLTDDIGFDAIVAATAIPGFFSPLDVAGEPHMDGALMMNTPLMPAIEAGADTIFIVYLDPDVRSIPLRRLRNTLDTMDRARNVNFAAKVTEDIETARWINDGLEVIERVARGDEPSDFDARAFVRTASRIHDRIRKRAPYRKLTVHRFGPRDDFGGILGLLNFDREQITRLIEFGYSDTIRHDCAANHCLLPHERPLPPGGGT